MILALFFELLKMERSLLINFVILALLVISQVAGNVALSYSIKQLGEVNTVNPLLLIQYIWLVMQSYWTWIAVVLLILALVLYLVAVSRLDLSYVLPMIASNYVVTTLAAWLILKEHVSFNRWTGTLLVTAGVLLVGLGELRQKSRKAKG